MALFPPEDLPDQPEERVEVAVDDPFLERDDAVVGNLDLLGADLGAAARDVAKAGPELLAECRHTVLRVERVHLEGGQADHESRASELVHARHAGEPGPPVDLHAAGAAFAGLAVPADGQVVGEPRLDSVQDVEHDHAGVDVDAVLDERAARRRAAPDAEQALRHDSPPGLRSWRRRWRRESSAAPVFARPRSPSARLSSGAP